MKNLCFLVFSALMLTTQPFFAQRNIEVSDFDELNVTGGIEVVLVQGEKESVELRVENIPEDKVSVKVSRGVLRIQSLQSLVYKNESIQVRVTYRKLRAIRGNAGANIQAEQTLGGDELLLRAGSGSKIDLQLELSSVDAGASEGGILTLGGKTERMEVDASTGGKVMALELESKKTYAHASTGGYAEVNAQELLEASANTSGNIRYKGNPQGGVSLKTVLSGKVEQI